MEGEGSKRYVDNVGENLNSRNNFGAVCLSFIRDYSDEEMYDNFFIAST